MSPPIDTSDSDTPIIEVDCPFCGTPYIRNRGDVADAIERISTKARERGISQAVLRSILIDELDRHNDTDE